MVFGILASIAEFETALRRERRWKASPVPRPKARQAGGRHW
ncbi:hypothetical protein [Mesorhizobium sp.]